MHASINRLGCVNGNVSSDANFFMEHILILTKILFVEHLVLRSNVCATLCFWYGKDWIASFVKTTTCSGVVHGYQSEYAMPSLPAEIK